ncbi:MAG: Amidase related to nicotinamidase [Verrucomicrobiales bacterium]|nr:Amidase related to nicotinamidase [Verrucomicrobiales bacterium]
MAKTGDSLLKASDSALLIVDIQEKFRPVVPSIEGVIRNAEILARAAVRLKIPVLASEQYPKGLGATVADLRQWLPADQEYSEKLRFSALGSDSVREGLKTAGRGQVVMTGLETHVCVMQSGLELMAAGYSLYLVTDAVASRKSPDREAALQRLQRHGAELVTTEMVIFEWLRAAGTPEFKELQALVK